MRFDNLEVALRLNEDESPSLTLAFYVIQSLVKDIETASGTKFKNADIGDEDEFPSLLANQCRTVRTVYEANSDKLTFNQKRLEELVHKLDEIQEKLSDAEKKDQEARKLESDLTEKEKELEALEERFRTLEENRLKYEELCEKCDGLRSDIDSMKDYDINEKQKELENLKKDYDKSDVIKRQLIEQLSALNSSNEELSSELESLKKANQSAAESKEKLTNQISELKALNVALDSEIDALSKECSAHLTIRTELEKKKQEALLQKTSLEKTNNEKGREYREYYEKNILPIENDIANLDRMILQQEQQKAEIQAEKDILDKRYTEILMTISRLQKEKPEVETQIADREGQYQKSLLDREKLDQKNKASLKRLSDLQDEIEKINEASGQLESQLIPHALETLEAAKNKNGLLTDELEKISGEMMEYDRKAALLQEKIDANNLLLEQRRINLDNLRTKHKVSSDEITKLEEQLEELKGKTDREAVATMRDQLKRDIEEYKALQEESRRLDQECAQTRKRCEAAAQNIEKLKTSKEAFEKDRIRTEKLQDELAYFDGEEFRNECLLLRHKFELLIEVKNKLIMSSKKLGALLGFSDNPINTVLSDEVEADLKEINDYFDSLQETMIRYADGLFKK